MSTSEYQKYISPLSQRYPSKEMQYLFSQEKKFRTWRRLWIALAEAEKELGLPIDEAQIQEMILHQEDINYQVAEEKEREIRHDVMAHVYAYGVQCPLAKPILHWGATSCYVGDNTDLLVMKEGLDLLVGKVVNVVDYLSRFAMEYRELPTLGFTHFQPAQPVTVGKRAALWIQDLLMDLQELEGVRDGLLLLGSKGTTGTQASFYELFQGDEEKVRKLDQLISQKMDMPGVVPVSGQTYSRKIDARVLQILAGIAVSAHKFANDIRLLAHLKEVEEPFEENQVGSSAMAYKRNPMRSERITGLARHVMTLTIDGQWTAASQWLERTLDDSSNKRISISEGFLTTDAILELYMNVASGLVVYPKVMEKHLLEELPFMATENLLMEAVKGGKDRQELHERIRVHSMAAAQVVKEQGGENDLLLRLSQDPAFGMSLEEMEAMMAPEKFVGMAPQQTQRYIQEEVMPLLKKYEDRLGQRGQVQV
ncbi:MAG: adenylosuccinate lyase [Dehalobacter sp. 4CP]|nr:adenylosuccinate lyase [Dehalobacter sp. 4CP]